MTFKEQETITLMSKILNINLVKAHPSWLTNISGNVLELDGYNSEKLLGIEYQGRDHLNTKQRVKDLYKKTKCVNYGLFFIEIFYYDTYNESTFLDMLKRELIDKGYILKTDYVNLVYEFFKEHNRIKPPELKIIKKICKVCGKTDEFFISPTGILFHKSNKHK